MKKKRLITSILVGGLMVLTAAVPSFGMGSGTPGGAGGGAGGSSGGGIASGVHMNTGPASAGTTASASQQLGQMMQAIQANPGTMGNYAAAGQLMEQLGQTGMKVFANGQQVDFSTYGVQPVIKDGRTLVPVRSMMSALGAQVSWDPATQTVTVTSPNGTTIQMTIGSDQMTVDGQSVTLDVPPYVMDGRTMLPLRAMAQAMGMDVNWLGRENMVVLSPGQGTGTSVEPSVYSGNTQSVTMNVYHGSTNR